ncbi:ABC transporter substrate-binding protein [Chelativorans sp. AA-79]|uniref:ABC transporter substrate-binding protein n=1 Tax=Chelativorans sp. AA-79 TaxID=3028735 RepID=UPI0023F7FD5D|nr:ABC transporter substrate-binding protein [Chelativorans sp. AA-79]WEX08014.1 ABC transporter substrate-binding protein [Chelativorans sp. AA-79]
MRKLVTTMAVMLLATTAAFAQTREVIDDAGRTVQIPEKPQRIIAMHEALIALPLIELGFDVIGVYGRADDGASIYDVDFIKSVFGDDPSLQIGGIGPVGDIDLEKLRALKPDLIVGMGRQLAQSEILSAIAPVYLQTTMAGSESGFSIEEQLAKAFGRTAVFDVKRASYLERVEEVRASLPEDPRGKTYLAIIVFDQISAVRDVSGAIQAIRDLGYEPYDWANRVTNEPAKSRGFAVPLSSEEFALLDPDLLVIMNSYMSADHSEGGIRARLDAIAPGWSRFMRAAKEDQIVFLNSAEVATPTIRSALHTLAAFEEWGR